MSIPVIKIERDTFTLKSSVGKLYDENCEFFCHTLEDVSRGYGVKLKGETCLAPGRYMVKITRSSRFKRDMPIVYTDWNGYEASMGGISFRGVRLHGGNTHKNTEGCPLVAHKRLNDDLIQGTAEKDLTKKIGDLIAVSEKDFIYLEIVNMPYSK
tara:strand:+ start:381 stop:845 length:465 start_codon:yes stop_codon:yes gene_type:complete